MKRETYFQGLRFLEIDALNQGASIKSLRKWRRMAPGASFALWFAPSGFSAEESERLVGATEALSAEAVVVRSPPELTPSALHRDRLRRWFGEEASPERLGGALQVWEPQGPWQPDQAVRFAEEMGVVLALDPLAPDPLGELQELLAEPAAAGRAYYRLLGLGRARRRYPPEDLELLAELCRERADESWVAFAHLEKWRDALRFQEVLGVS